MNLEQNSQERMEQSGLIEGINSYVELRYADFYVRDRYASGNAMRKKWETLTDADKIAYLKDSTYSIDQLPFAGCKLTPGQALAFPRIKPQRMIFTPFPYGRRLQQYDTGYYRSGINYEKGYERAQNACIENALAHAFLEDQAVEALEHRLAGVQSESIGHTSTSYKDIENNTNMKEAGRGIYAPDKVYAIFKGWLPTNYITT